MKNSQELARLRPSEPFSYPSKDAEKAHSIDSLLWR